VKALQPEIQVIGAEPARADDAMRSLISGQIESSGDPKTVADGLRTSLGEKNFEVIRKNVDRIVTATEVEILTAMQFVWERFKIIIEPSCAVAVAPLMFNKLPELHGKNVGVIITGGNLDLEPLFESLRNRFIDS
jgi:threonine dehydratase